MTPKDGPGLIDVVITVLSPAIMAVLTVIFFLWFVIQNIFGGADDGI
jgi:hypothetical protein